MKLSALEGKHIAVSSNTASPLRELACHMGSESPNLRPARGDIPAFIPAEARTRFSDPGGMQGCILRKSGATGGSNSQSDQSKPDVPTATPSRNSCTNANLQSDKVPLSLTLAPDFPDGSNS